MHSVILYFGSFNPVHKGHMAVAEWILEQGLCNEVWFVVSPQNPLKRDGSLIGEEERLAMVRLAAAASRYSRRMRACDVEFSLPRPSYTVDTLSVLTERYPDTTFSLLVGSDIPGQITQWKDCADGGRRRRYGSGCCQRVYQNTGIMEHRQEIERLTAAIEASPEDMTLYAERGKIHFRAHDFGSALNDFNRVLLAEEHNEEIRQYVKMINEILEFRYNDIYNP